jgi:RNA polymerase sigma-70 factor (ECF subfamily)
MPPVPLWYRGREDCGRFIAQVFTRRGTGWRMLPAAANGQPALVAYVPDGGVHRLHTLQVVSLRGGLVSRVVVLQDPRVLAAFGSAEVLG